MKILEEIYADIAKNLDKHMSIKESLANYKKRLGEADKKKGIILIDPVNLVPINAVPSKASAGKYLELNKLAAKKSGAKDVQLENLFKAKLTLKAKVKPKTVVKGKKSCPPGKALNPKTGRCKKM